MHSEDVKYAAEHLKQLIGFKIVDTVTTPDNESYGFVVERKALKKPYAKKVCWVDCDPEGNGPGWLQIEEKADELEKVTSG